MSAPKTLGKKAPTRHEGRRCGVQVGSWEDKVICRNARPGSWFAKTIDSKAEWVSMARHTIVFVGEVMPFRSGLQLEGRSMGNLVRMPKRRKKGQKQAFRGAATGRRTCHLGRVPRKRADGGRTGWQMRKGKYGESSVLSAAGGLPPESSFSFAAGPTSDSLGAAEIWPFFSGSRGYGSRTSSGPSTLQDKPYPSVARVPGGTGRPKWSWKPNTNEGAIALKGEKAPKLIQKSQKSMMRRPWRDLPSFFPPWTIKEADAVRISAQALGLLLGWPLPASPEVGRRDAYAVSSRMQPGSRRLHSSCQRILSCRGLYVSRNVCCPRARNLTTAAFR